MNRGRFPPALCLHPVHAGGGVYTTGGVLTLRNTVIEDNTPA
jgi:hypothetical protein